MKVKELINQLQKLNQELEVYFCDLEMQGLEEFKVESVDLMEPEDGLEERVLLV